VIGSLPRRAGFWGGACFTGYSARTMRRSIERLLRRSVVCERRDLAVGIPEAPQRVTPRDRGCGLLLLRLGLLLSRSCVKKARKALLVRVGNMRRRTKLQIIAQPFCRGRLCGVGHRGVPRTRVKCGP
jgi:hypothetical protein